MFDTMTATKIVGALCGTLLVFLLANFVAETIYTTAAPAHSGEGEQLAQAYTIDTGAAAETPAAEEGPPFAEILAAADAAAGEKVFAKCAACHKVDGTNGVGPHLNGVVGRNKASVEGFEYSEALLAQGAEPWSPENINAFLTNPKGYVPGTKMNYNGLPKVEDRANIIAWLATKP
jgi:cytochrome c